ncbi:MAG TPA: zf-TFIIB domain-containing protein [Vicinamibacterales bacterium]|nr:zf-TFIIB domain-containing protein [Acidobacteriota bacterium]HOC19113.1 zf-TFIIB domain-containing protein [Vicinamibacterales bacterium]
MNCRNCGAAMDFHESRRYFRCAHCGSIHFPEPAKGDVRVLGVEATAPPCPVCGVALASALLSERAVHYCERCRGLLLDRGTFVEVVQTKRAWAAAEPREPRPVDPREAEREALCPRCRARMATHPYYGPGRIIIDTCEACDLIWLDPGELDRVVDAPGRDRGSSLRGGEGAWRDREERGVRHDDDDDERRRSGWRSSGRINLLDLLFDG